MRLLATVRHGSAVKCDVSHASGAALNSESPVVDPLIHEGVADCPPLFFELGSPRRSANSVGPKWKFVFGSGHV